MENFRFYLAGEKLYAYIWHRLADEIIEEQEPKEYGNTLYYLLENSLKLLHPLCLSLQKKSGRYYYPDARSGHRQNSLASVLMVEKWPFDFARGKPK